MRSLFFQSLCRIFVSEQSVGTSIEVYMGYGGGQLIHCFAEVGWFHGVGDVVVVVSSMYYLFCLL